MYDALFGSGIASFFKDLSNWIRENASFYVPTAAFCVSICSLLFTAVSFRGTKKSGDLTSLIKFVETLQAVEKEFISEEDESKKDDRFVDLLNIFETYCAAYNARLLPAKTKEIVRDKLVDSMALLRNSQIWAKKYAESQLGPTAFSELKRFEKSHKRRIASASKSFSTPPPPAPVV